MSIVRLKNSSLKGEIVVPPSKSAAHRALVCSFLAGGGNVSPIINSNDMRAMEQVITSLNNSDDVLDCIESGNTLRFMIPVAAALGREVTFVGEGRLPDRPIGDYLRLLPEHGVKCECQGKLPLKISGKLESGTYKLAGNISSQYITGLLLALPLLDGDSEIVLTTELQSKPYVDMTIKVMSDFGVEVSETENGYFVKGNQTYQKRDYIVESDWSQAAFFLVAGAINGDVVLKGLDMNSTQGDKEIVNILKRFGADIQIGDDFIRCKKSQLKGINIDATDIPDTVPSLAVCSAFAQGETVISGAQRLRFKESDRIESVVTNLKKMGVDVKETPDGMIIKGGNVHGGELDGYNDHRIPMSFSIAALCADGETTITDAQSINKTYPTFFEDYNSIGGKADVL
jgi:3-phosphoshikimate 1-carboxyvinyltransferase